MKQVRIPKVRVTKKLLDPHLGLSPKDEKLLEGLRIKREQLMKELRLDGLRVLLVPTQWQRKRKKS